MASDIEVTSRARRTDGETTYQELLDAALEIWSEQGIGHVTMNAVAKRAGRARGTAYHHFADHEALIAAVQDKLKARLESLFDIKNIEARDAYRTFTSIIANAPQVLRSYFTQLLRSGPSEDPVVKMAVKHFQELRQLGWLHAEVDPEHAALIGISIWLAALLAVDAQPPGPARSRAAASFAKTFQLVMERAILKQTPGK